MGTAAKRRSAWKLWYASLAIAWQRGRGTGLKVALASELVSGLFAGGVTVFGAGRDLRALSK
jgi:hypothetical protein